MKIIEVDHGIGTNFGTHIEINRHLPDYLKKKVIDHELNHSSKGFSFKELVMDLVPELDIRLYIWMLFHPKSLVNFFPYKKGFIDYNLIIGYTIFGILIGGVFYYW